jgi:putative molybdopterin biosynthesis protein
MQDSSTAPAFLTTREVADLLRVRERKVYEMAAEGEIPCRRVTGKLLFPRAELQAWLAGGIAGPAETPPDIVAGSHDPLLDWAIRESGSGLATFFDGSLDGIERVAQRRAIAAGMHVFEPEHEDWNRRTVQARAGAAPVVLVEWAVRQQGLIVAPGLTPPVSGVADLAGRRVVQRQPTAGAGLLLAHLLERQGVRDVTFLPEVARTETDAAAAIAAGKAEAAPGLEAVARQFGLPFVATVRERFDLVVDRRAWFEPPVQGLLRFARSEAFVAKARELGGYDTSGFGTVHWNAP